MHKLRRKTKKSSTIMRKILDGIYGAGFIRCSPPSRIPEELQGATRLLSDRARSQMGNGFLWCKPHSHGQEWVMLKHDTTHDKEKGILSQTYTVDRYMPGDDLEAGRPIVRVVFETPYHYDVEAHLAFQKKVDEEIWPKILNGQRY